MNNGMEVTVHQSPITQDGWTGVGYIISDPATGSGAYEIEGGGRGGVLGNWAKHGTFYTAAVAVLSIAAVVGGAGLLLTFILLVVAILFAFLNYWVTTLQSLEAGCASDISAGSMITEIFGWIIGTQGIQGAIFSLFWGIFSSKKLGGMIKNC